MADFKFNCPHCRQPLEAPDEMLGQIIDCPSCNRPIQIPRPQPNVSPTDKARTESRAKVRSDLASTAAPSPQKQPPRSKVLLFTLIGLAVAVVSLAAVVVFLVTRGATENSKHTSIPPTAPEATPSTLQAATAARKAQEAEAAEARRKVEEEEARRTAAETKQREEERQRQERLANMRGSVEGGAWVIKGGGQSELIRGLTVIVLPGELDSQLIEPALAKLRKDCTYWEESNRKTAEEYSRPVPHVTDSGFDDMTKFVPEHRTTEMLMKKYGEKVDGWTKNPIRLKTLDVFTTTRRVNRDCQGTESGTSLYLSHVERDKVWPTVVAATALTKGTTGIDAKYSISDLKPGEYILYAQMSSAFSLIEWCIPVTVNGEQTIKLDFFNDNAALILNKR